VEIYPAIPPIIIKTTTAIEIVEMSFIDGR